MLDAPDVAGITGALSVRSIPDPARPATRIEHELPRAGDEFVTEWVLLLR